VAAVFFKNLRRLKFDFDIVFYSIEEFVFGMNTLLRNIRRRIDPI